ncbi:hypothetical protein HOLleu_09990 [Holothuria leucospilota]|uniref:Uncharacterized protein n=1 Tax=Holothuria leucospilota TaxID=206669 RepID=A0A9Q1CDQ5_HOLLE|nr:hypothetical protein HOLleu_09990 [Holothuria leucospilota]
MYPSPQHPPLGWHPGIHRGKETIRSGVHCLQARHLMFRSQRVSQTAPTLEISPRLRPWNRIQVNQDG